MRLTSAVCYTIDSGVTATPGAPAPPEGPSVPEASVRGKENFFVYFSFSYQKD